MTANTNATNVVAHARRGGKLAPEKKGTMVEAPMDPSIGKSNTTFALADPSWPMVYHQATVTMSTKAPTMGWPHITNATPTIQSDTNAPIWERIAPKTAATIVKNPMTYMAPEPKADVIGCMLLVAKAAKKPLPNAPSAWLAS